MPYWVYLLLAGVVILVAMILGRAIAFRSRRYTVEPEHGIKIDRTGPRSGCLGLQLPTITASDPEKAERAPLSSLSITWSSLTHPPMQF